MRRISKFKIFKKTKTFLLECPNKILNFKKSSWLFYKNILKKRDKKRSHFINYAILGCKKYGGFQKKFSFGMNLKLRRQLIQHFDCAIKSNSFRNSLLKNLKIGNKSNINVIKEIFVRFEYRLDIVLYRLNFFSSSFEARKAIQSGSVEVNGKIIKNQNYITKKGDIINILNSLRCVTDILKRKLLVSHFNSFLEVDYYTRTVIIVKDLSEITSLDLALLSTLQVRSSRLYRAFYQK